MARSLAPLLVIPVLFCSSANAKPRLTQADNISARLNKEVFNYNLGVYNMVGALMRVSNDFNIPMGIVWVSTAATRSEIPFAWKDAKLGEIIEGIAKAQPGYTVQMRNGVVHVLPAGLIPDEQNFLNMKIDAFETHKAIVELASFKLHTAITPIKGSHQISIGGTGDSEVTLALKNCKVQDVLDALVVASNRKIWTVTFAEDTSLTSRGLRRAISLWNDKPGPDAGQPAWDLLRWGDPMPPLVSGTPLPQQH